MKLDRVKIELLQAKSCMSTSELLQKAKISFPVLLNAGKKNMQTYNRREDSQSPWRRCNRNYRNEVIR